VEKGVRIAGLGVCADGLIKGLMPFDPSLKGIA
jgi:hypothetical protein